MKKAFRSRISGSESVKRRGLRVSREVVRMLAADDLSQVVSGCPTAVTEETKQPASATACAG
jgi:hypothetical protein